MTGAHRFIPSPLLEPPANLGVERAIIGSLLGDNRRFELVADILQPEHFHDPICARVFGDIAVRIRAGQGIDLITLRGQYQAAGVLDELGGADQLIALLTHTAPNRQLASYASEVVNLWRRREVIRVAQDAISRATVADPQDLGETIASDIAGELLALADDGTKTGAITAGEAAAIALRDAEVAFRNGGRPPGVRTGIAGLDDMLGGLAPSQFIVLGARPAVGKTVFALNVALAAAQVGIGVAFFSLEMSAGELGGRLLSNIAKIPGSQVRDGRMPQPWHRAVQAQHDLDALPLIFDDTPGLTVEQIRLRTMAMSRKYPVGLVCIDHLGLIRASKDAEKQGLVAATEQTSKALKRMAKELAAPVLALAQLNRGLEAREDKRPMLSDLRNSGSIEQDADVVVFIHRPEVHLRNREPSRRDDESSKMHDERVTAWRANLDAVAGRGELVIAKQRRGPTGTVPIRFDGAISRIYDAGGGLTP